MFDERSNPGFGEPSGWYCTDSSLWWGNGSVALSGGSLQGYGEELKTTWRCFLQRVRLRRQSVWSRVGVYAGPSLARSS